MWKKIRLYLSALEEMENNSQLKENEKHSWFGKEEVGRKERIRGEVEGDRKGMMCREI